MKLQLRWMLYSILITLSIQLPVYAQDEPAVKYAYVTDSVGAHHASSGNVIAANIPKVVIVANADNSLNAAGFDEEIYLQELASLDKYDKHHNPKPIVNLLKDGKFKAVSSDKKRSHKFYYHLANIFTRLKMYPLAMKCYFKTLPLEEEQLTDSLSLGNYAQQNNDPSVVLINNPTDTSVAGLLAINSKDEQLLTADTSGYVYNSKEIQSKPETMDNIIDPFDDGKKASAYALMIHIQQPLSGKRKIYIKLNKVGHTFITLIKYNSDSTSVSRSFGFYPKKDHFLSATPLFPSSTSVFKNDELHSWDETIGRFISERKFKKILEVIKEYDQKRYNLNKNNCTDFGLNLAGTAGIKIMDTRGSWPLGSGNNPASAGQSVLEGKVLNTDGNYSLFICNDLDLKP
ncbi:hypothetical protein [Mucilaginibacter sp. SP1R1]|uniref:hypothetical protein n=1 Tax=Mucilaginibacter sp. SP1R1 TaxID=2723091 RepID=UPI00160A4385|nr:hypothetical protein [Mucilaginibacter sp. SP1R1]MBB6152761.1 hypothetical protein [Mucilaginibacter sp. SP1R1]